MTLGFSVNDLLPKARGGGQLRMGLVRLPENEWLQAQPDLNERSRAFSGWREGVQLTPEAEEPGCELAAILGVDGALPEAALSAHEDMCLLTQSHSGAPYRLIGTAVAWPTDWRPKEKIGLPLRALHAPIAGYKEQLATGVDRFMETLRPGMIYGRCNWFISPTGNRRWLVEGSPTETFAHVTPDNAGETLFVRSERQTLRRLPETGAILFTIGVYVSPLASLGRTNTQHLASAVQALVSGEGERRGAGAYAAALISYASG